jgi:4-diphosphocytidyl-2-C-methyl-D-erythritol kinase
MSYIRVLAPAKINIGLRVLPVRGDGYHAIESIFQTVSLFDTLMVRRTGEQARRCTVECAEMDLPEHNTLTKAYQGFCEASGVCGDIEVKLHKGIPSGSGLGGGSSDAAFLLRALDSLFGTNLPHSILMEIAAGVGSDVFFFLCCDANGSAAAIVTGRGEEVSPIKARKLPLVLICPAVHSSTAEAYRLVDEYAENDTQVYPACIDIEQMYQNDTVDWAFVNSFTKPLCCKYTKIAEAMVDLQNAGACYVQMSGSGSSVFGVFDSEFAACCGAAQLVNKWQSCYALSTIC